ncbi:hypothetical protein MES4922_370051 [Mesorhizobium ventifaucium]|uniref:Uncharacterized protein n=1 Tax=Mesorhizobium ventifaucium TaxID=666020 RepID=A0ABM9E6S4_9HYPH|nr:hypothetical protein MES4922_370051 [Mesorhizobium ventifaucium]
MRLLPGTVHTLWDTGAGGRVTLRIRLPGGTLKIKKKDELRRREQKRQVPVWRVGATSSSGGRAASRIVRQNDDPEPAPGPFLETVPEMVNDRLLNFTPRKLSSCCAAQWGLG